MAHPLNAVDVYLTPSGEHKYGEALWKAAGAYREENFGAAPLEMVVVEIKG